MVVRFFSSQKFSKMRHLFKGKGFGHSFKMANQTTRRSSLYYSRTVARTENRLPQNRCFPFASTKVIRPRFGTLEDLSLLSRLRAYTEGSCKKGALCSFFRNNARRKRFSNRTCGMGNEDTRLNWPPFREDYRYGFIIWCRGYSEGDSSEDSPEDFTFISPSSFSETPTPLCEKSPDPEEGTSPKACEIEIEEAPEGDKAEHELSFDYWLSSKGGPSSKVEGSPSSSENTSEATASVYPKKSQSHSPFSDSQMEELLERLNRHSPPRQVGDNRPSVPEPSKNSSWWESFLCLCRGPETEEETGNGGNGRDGSGENDPGE